MYVPSHVGLGYTELYFLGEYIRIVYCRLSCEFTAQKDRVIGEKVPTTELKLGNYTLSQSFSHASHQSRLKSFIPIALKNIIYFGLRDWDSK